MIICGIEKFSMVDYLDKITCTVFSEGCNFRCPFCQNSSLVVGGQKNTAICEEELFEYLEKRKKLVDAVCISGGEPTLQKDLAEFIKKIRALGYSIKLDTNGAKPQVLKDLVEAGIIDYVAMDIKNSFAKYGETIGIDNFDVMPIRQSIDYIMSCGVDYEFRTTLVGGYHSEKSIAELSSEIAGAKRYYLQKFVDSGSCIASGLEEVDEEEAIIFKSIAEKNIKNVQLRGY